MEIKENQNGHPEGCRCGMCRIGTMCGNGHCCCGRRRFILRIVITVIVIVVVFSCGFKLGELKSVSYGGWFHHGYRMMGAPYYGYQGSVQPGGYKASSSTSTTTPNAH